MSKTEKDLKIKIIRRCFASNKWSRSDVLYYLGTLQIMILEPDQKTYKLEDLSDPQISRIYDDLAKCRMI